MLSITLCIARYSRFTARAELLLQTLMLTLHYCKSSSPVGIEPQPQDMLETELAIKQ